MIFWVAWEAVETDDAGVFEKIKTLFMGAKFLLPVSGKKKILLYLPFLYLVFVKLIVESLSKARIIIIYIIVSDCLTAYMR